MKSSRPVPISTPRARPHAADDHHREEQKNLPEIEDGGRDALVVRRVERAGQPEHGRRRDEHGEACADDVDPERLGDRLALAGSSQEQPQTAPIDHPVDDQSEGKQADCGVVGDDRAGVCAVEPLRHEAARSEQAVRQPEGVAERGVRAEELDEAEREQREIDTAKANRRRRDDRAKQRAGCEGDREHLRPVPAVLDRQVGRHVGADTHDRQSREGENPRCSDHQAPHEVDRPVEPEEHQDAVDVVVDIERRQQRSEGDHRHPEPGVRIGGRDGPPGIRHVPPPGRRRARVAESRSTTTISRKRVTRTYWAPM